MINNLIPGGGSGVARGPGSVGNAERYPAISRGGNHATYYANPNAIVSDTSLTRAQRLRLLDDWAQDLADRQVATAEGMLPPSPSRANADAQLLRNVNAGIETIETAGSDSEGPLARAWRRLTLD